MLVHILLCKPLDDLPEAGRQELANSLSSLADLPQIQSMSWGPDTSGRSRGYTHAAVMLFADRDGLQSYQSDPAHLRVVAILDRLLADRLVVDYETGMSDISL